MTKESPETEDAPQHTSKGRSLACKVMERRAQKLIFDNIRKSEQGHLYWVGKRCRQVIVREDGSGGHKGLNWMFLKPGHWVTKGWIPYVSSKSYL